MGPTARKRTAEERAAERQLQAAALAALDAPTVRQSTRQRTEDAERDRLEQVQRLSRPLSISTACTWLPALLLQQCFACVLFCCRSLSSLLGCCMLAWLRPIRSMQCVCIVHRVPASQHKAACCIGTRCQICSSHTSTDLCSVLRPFSKHKHEVTRLVAAGEAKEEARAARSQAADPGGASGRGCPDRDRQRQELAGELAPAEHVMRPVLRAASTGCSVPGCTSP